MPRSYYIQFRSGANKSYIGNESTVPGDAVRSDFSDFMWQHEHFKKWAVAVANSTEEPWFPDLPQNYFLDEYAAEKNLTGDALDELLLFYSNYATLDAAQDLGNVGMSNDVWRQYKLDKEWMVSSPNGYRDLAVWLAKGLSDVRLNTVVEAIEWGEEGVTIQLRGGGNISGSMAIVTVPIGVLKTGGILFDPPLPPWKQRAIHNGAMGVLEKMYLRWDKPWWLEAGVDADTFWKAFLTRFMPLTLT